MTTGGIQNDQTPYTGTPPNTQLPTDKLGADKTTFLRLLVTQLQNQNPLNPSDGVEFVTQLAQFTALEQSTSMRDDIAAIRKLLTEQPNSSPDTTGSK
jgi:flagellar basal-body rod modification protein FlgD